MGQLVPFASERNNSPKRHLMKYFAFIFASIVIKPLSIVTLKYLDQDALADHLAVFLLVNQILLGVSGTQIHKRKLVKGQSEKSLLVSSLYEGLYLVPFAFVFLYILYGELYIAMVAFNLLFEKVIEDLQRYRIYTGELISFAWYAFLRALLIAVIFFGALISSSIIDPMLAYTFFGLIFVLRYAIPKNYRVFRRQIVAGFISIKRGLIGISISVLSVFLAQADKYLFSGEIGELSNYYLAYQIVSIFLVIYSLLFYNKHRHLSIKQPDQFIGKMIRPLVLFSSIITAFSTFLFLNEGVLQFILGDKFGYRFQEFIIYGLWSVMVGLWIAVYYEVLYWKQSLFRVLTIELVFAFFHLLYFFGGYEAISIVLGILTVRAIYYSSSYYLSKRFGVTNVSND